MNQIIEPDDNFDFTKITLAHPVGVQGGAYFTKILNNNKPLYIQTPKCLTRQGFVKSGKKYYCDIMFDNSAAEIINWFECLEEKCQKLIFEKADTWFQNALEMSDVESAFNSIIRIYKSGKFYLVRANIKNSVSNEPLIKIYDENQLSMKMEDINHETNVICILEIQGIKFTTRNFQIEIELKQMMVINDDPGFDSCLIKTNKMDVNTNTSVNNTSVKVEQPKNIEKESVENVKCFIDEMEQNLKEIKQKEEHLEENMDMKGGSHQEYKEDNKEQKTQDSTNDIDMSELNVENLDDDFLELKEVELNVDNLDNSITLKKPNQVYFELYKIARDKAKMAKKAAIIAYLEAKNIKKTYMIENIDTSDTEFDQEIEDVSESELENF